MSLPASAYTPPGGGTVQGQQSAQTSNLLASASPVGTGAPSIPNLQQAQGNATQQLAGMQTPQSRSAVVGNSDVPAIQSNYDQVAQQLYQYDQMHLAPQYANQPAPTGDYASFGRVTPSSLFQLTPDQAAGPTTLFANNPSYAMTSQANQKNNILDILDTLNNSLSKEFSSARGKYASTVQSQKDLLGTITDMLSRATDAQLAREKMANDVTVAEINQGVLPGSATGTGGAGDDTGLGTGNAADRARVQAIYNSYPPESAAAGRIASNWQKAFGTPLFPNPPKSAEVSQIKTSADALNRMNQAIAYIKANPDIQLGWLGGNFQDFLIGGAGGKLASFANPKDQHLYDLLKPLEGAADRALIGGRMSGYLRDVFKGAFASINKEKPTILDELTQGSQIAQDDLNSYAQAHGYNDYTEMPGVITGDKSATSTIRVRDNASGQTGTIPVGEFDPKLYTRL